MKITIFHQELFPIGRKAFLDSIGIKEKEDRKLSETEKELQNAQKILEEKEREIERLWKEQHF